MVFFNNKKSFQHLDRSVLVREFLMWMFIKNYQNVHETQNKLKHVLMQYLENFIHKLF